jgi:CRISPR-associated endonuclease/helicase Cas3
MSSYYNSDVFGRPTAPHITLTDAAGCSTVRIMVQGGDTDFDGFVRSATGFAGPYPYQRRLAGEGLPVVLRAPTGSGKTGAAVLPWLYRRRIGPTAEIRAGTPRRLVIALPMRTLVDQTVDVARRWVDRLGWGDEVAVTRIMGGDGPVDGRWRLRPEADAVLVGTIDMVLSRALNRGYAMGKGSWPIDFGLVNNDVQWVFDEVQLMGPALPTSRQLQAWRDRFGTVGPSRSMWMSATLDLAALATVDAPPPAADRVVELDADDLDDPGLRRRVEAVRRIGAAGTVDDLTDVVTTRHRPGTRTIVVHNTVQRAQETYRRLLRAGVAADVVLVHSRFRPPDRQAAMDRVLADPDPAGPGTIVITTQALEAGVDITSSCLITEVAPWPSIVQRAGRCNRYGESPDAELLWVTAPAPAPYDQADIDAAEAALVRLEGLALTGAALAEQRVPGEPPLHPVIRRKDLVELFDTAPDLSGNDVDVSRYIRDGDDIDVHVAWRSLVDGDRVPEVLEPAVTTPQRNELCAAPVHALRKAVGGKGVTPVWRFDDAADRWQRCRRVTDIVPGGVYLADSAFGRYVPDLGWDDKARGVVPPVHTPAADDATAYDAGAGDERLSAIGTWVRLADHLSHAGDQATTIIDGLDLADPLRTAVVQAAQLHDVGKAHEVFQETMRRAAAEREMADAGGPWAKSSRARQVRHRRAGFSHALAGALALLHPGAAPLVESLADPDLVRYLVGAHHGRVRLGIRSGPEEAACGDGVGSAIGGICDGEVLPAVDTPLGRLPSVTLDLSAARMGGSGSLTAAALALRDRGDLGIFRLGFLEALVRMADWRASQQEIEES